MEWTIHTHENPGYLEVVTTGVVDKDGSWAMIQALAAAGEAARIKRVLVDHRNIDHVSGGAVDVFERPKQLRQIGFHGIRVALLAQPQHKNFFDFLATVCVNQGYDFAVFMDRKAALNWLLT